ncbi:AraC family transcriptional regulator [Paraburkholderia phytofirmans]|uniref:AraC family transcriptional regulator n=1 Tax=Paraburkholderia phytofirmans TaxID=261302 RepID=UPI0038BA1A45
MRVINGDPPVEDEVSWRNCSRLDETTATSCIAIAHWRDNRETDREMVAPVFENHYVIEVMLRNTVVECFRGGRRISKGSVGFGGTQICAPGNRITCRFKKQVEAIHIYVPASEVLRIYTELHRQSDATEFQLIDPAFSADPIMGKLAWTLLETNGLRSPFSRLYCESLAMAVLARAMEFKDGELAVVGSRSGLLPWRLRRCIEYIEDNLGAALTLNDIAEHAGLSRMHFAAQFKQTTGLSPHAYLMNKRLEMAKAMLLEEEVPIVQIAFSVGFRSQAHFTSVFRKVTGTTPARWRKQAVLAASLVSPPE